MSNPVDALVMDLVESIGFSSRPYAELIEAWRTSCPRLPVWEEANQRGLLLQSHPPDSPAMVALSPAGLKLLAERCSRQTRP